MSPVVRSEKAFHVVKLTGKQEVLKGFVRSGGIGAEILTGGVIRVGDPIVTG